MLTKRAFQASRQIWAYHMNPPPHYRLEGCSAELRRCGDGGRLRGAKARPSGSGKAAVVYVPSNFQPRRRPCEVGSVALQDNSESQV